jgi:protein SCO1
MRALAIIPILLTIACAPAAPKNTYVLRGQILSIEAPRKTLTIKHGEIKGLMPAMTMPYTVRDEKLLSGLAPGDLVDATLVVESNDAFLSRIQKTGTAPLDPSAAAAAAPTTYASGVELLKPGDAVPDAPFVTEDGRRVRFRMFAGAPIVMTFVYTRCPLPTFCPLMDRHFAEMQAPLAADPSLARVHLVTVTFDPEYDTPAVLKQHAESLHADPKRWTFLTGSRDDIDRFAARFGLVVSRAPNDPRDITHNLRTVVIDSHGKLVTTYTGNDWTPRQILADLKSVA